MKVLQINTVCSYGSTGRTACEIAKALESKGVESLIAFGQYGSDAPQAYKFGFRPENITHSVLARITGRQGMFSYFGTKQLIKKIREFSPDIIHLRNLHGNYVNIKLLLEYIAKNNIPVVMTAHDCWLYTGNCAHYTAVGCTRFTDGCGNCPQKKAYPPSLFVDSSKKMYHIKKKLYDAIPNMTVVAVSDWILSEINRSMLKDKKTLRIYNWIDMDVFYPRDSKAICEKYHIPEDKKIVLSVAGRFSPAKGVLDLLKLSEKTDDSVRIVLVGEEDTVTENMTWPENIIRIPYTENTDELAAIYSRADCFLNLSSAESFGKTTAEALCCGTPIIVYNTTACPELVGEGCGAVVEMHDIDGLSCAVNEILKNEKSFYSEKCVAFAKENFSKEKNILEYYKIYCEALRKEK